MLATLLATTSSSRWSDICRDSPIRRVFSIGRLPMSGRGARVLRRRRPTPMGCRRPVIRALPSAGSPALLQDLCQGTKPLLFRCLSRLGGSPGRQIQPPATIHPAKLSGLPSLGKISLTIGTLGYRQGRADAGFRGFTAGGIAGTSTMAAKAKKTADEDDED